MKGSSHFKCLNAFSAKWANFIFLVTSLVPCPSFACLGITKNVQGQIRTGDEDQLLQVVWPKSRMRTHWKQDQAFQALFLQRPNLLSSCQLVALVLKLSMFKVDIREPGNVKAFCYLSCPHTTIDLHSL